MLTDLKQLIKKFIPVTLYKSVLRRWRYSQIQWGSLRRVTPVCRNMYARGLPIDRYYIEAFLKTHQSDICGRVLEIGDAHYTRSLGGDRVDRSDVLHAESGNPQATIVGDLAQAGVLPANAFDCAILTQVFPFIYDVNAAISNCHSALKPGGVMLATLSGIGQITRYDYDRWGDYWRFTDLTAKRLFGDCFGAMQVTVSTHGNVLAACAFLHGLAAEELTPKELNYNDPDFQFLITVRAQKL
jgi:SAM-dependent methyltransferase